MPFYRFPGGPFYDLQHVPRDGERLSNVAGKKARAEYCRDELRKMLQPRATVYTSLRHVARSGMSRSISVHIVEDGEIRCIDQLVADACGFSQDKDGNIRMAGCGMDMGFALVYELGAYLWPDGTDTPHGTRNGEPDSTGGYALIQRWI
jgi:hypothetical protein